MTPATQSPLVPKLRFPEFRDAGEWVTRKLQDFLVLNYGMSLPAKDRVQGEFPIYGSNGIVGTHNEAFVSEQGIVIGRKGSAGHVHLSPGSFCPIDTTFYLTINDAPEVDFHFLYFLLKHADLRGIKDLGSVPGLNRKIAYMTQAFLPLSRREQQKIADCLGSLDDLIAAEGEKLEALRQHKQGLMQQLFPQPGEESPRLRFPEFRDKWQIITLGNVVTEFRARSTVQDEYEVLTSARRGLMRQVDYYGEGRITDRSNVGFNIIPPDHLTYRSRSDDGRFYFNHNHLGITGIVSIYYPIFYSTNGSNAFLAHLLNRFSGEIGKHSVGTSQRVLSMSSLLRFALPIPDVVEQQRIAAYFSSLDEVLAAQARKMDILRQHKQGLMRQLFPSLEGQ